jgi:hypothetical protein
LKSSVALARSMALTHIDKRRGFMASGPVRSSLLRLYAPWLGSITIGTRA